MFPVLRAHGSRDVITLVFLIVSPCKDGGRLVGYVVGRDGWIGFIGLGVCDPM